MSTRVFLVRHGATEWNLNRHAQGHADVPLTHEGEVQALKTAKDLGEFDIDAVYSSDLSRASDTARAIAHVQGLDVGIDPRLREIDQGEWTGLTPEEIRERWPDLWGPARHYSPRPGGESPQEVRERALAALKEIVERHPDSSVVVVSHGGTIRWISAEALGYDDRRAARLRGIGNGGVVCVQADLDDGELELSCFERFDGATADLDDPND